jgi:dolichol-phosphate mannosyltransferase
MITKLIEISVVVPVYNEENNIEIFTEQTVKAIENLNISYEILFILDPSTDNSLEKIKEQIKKNANIKLILFSRRFGQQVATMAGINNCKGENCVIIDCDLQDPPKLIVNLYKKLKDGYDVVVAKRKKRFGETIIKKIVSQAGYYFINKITDIEIPRDTGDFRIISKKIINELKKIDETSYFLRGLVSYIGYNQTYIEYDRDERKSGKGKYNQYFGSLKIGFDGIFGFSSKPLTYIFLFGICLSFFSFITALYYLYQKFFLNITPGLSTTIIFISFFSGVQIFILGVIGEYVGRIYNEVKKRPKYIIDKKINFDD